MHKKHLRTSSKLLGFAILGFTLLLNQGALAFLCWPDTTSVRLPHPDSKAAMKGEADCVDFCCYVCCCDPFRTNYEAYETVDLEQHIKKCPGIRMHTTFSGGTIGTLGTSNFKYVADEWEYLPCKVCSEYIRRFPNLPDNKQIGGYLTCQKALIKPIPMQPWNHEKKTLSPPKQKTMTTTRHEENEHESYESL